MTDQTVTAEKFAELLQAAVEYDPALIESCGVAQVTVTGPSLSFTLETGQRFTITVTTDESVSVDDISPAYDAERFIAAYITAARRSSNDDDGRPLDAEKTAEDIEPRTIRQMRLDCRNFILKNERDLSPHDASQAGHDFWLTRVGHGTGFWDRPEIWGEAGERLTEACKPFGDFDLYIGDNGLIGH